MQSLILTRPDDWHLHLRDGTDLETVIGASARQFRRAIVMPNLKPPVTTAALALAYRSRIKDAVFTRTLELDFEPLMTLYLTDNTSPEEVLLARQAGVVAFKYYPAGATTNSADGVTDIARVHRVLEAMQEVGMVLCLHGEVTDPMVDVFDREKVFIDRVLIPLRRDFPSLKMVLEHVTTVNAADYVTMEGGGVTAATITAHHLLINRNSIFMSPSGQMGLYGHNFCLPVAKRERHREALLQAATSGYECFFLGTDSAPHPVTKKMQLPSCAGCFTAPAALELYAEAFEEVDAINQLEAFASFHGADFYDLPRNTGTVTLVREPWQVPESVGEGDERIVPFYAGRTLQWKLAA